MTAEETIAEIVYGNGRTRDEHEAWAELCAGRALLLAERDEAVAKLAKLRELFPPEPAPSYEDECGKCGCSVTVDSGDVFEPGDPCHTCAAGAYLAARNLLDGARHA